MQSNVLATCNETTSVSDGLVREPFSYQVGLEEARLGKKQKKLTQAPLHPSWAPRKVSATSATATSLKVSAVKRA